MKWIEVSDKIPNMVDHGHVKQSAYVLVYQDIKERDVEICIGKAFCMQYPGGSLRWSCGVDVTHWMPLPESPYGSL